MSIAGEAPNIYTIIGIVVGAGSFIMAIVMPYLKGMRETERFRATEEANSISVAKQLTDMRDILKDANKEMKIMMEKSDGDVRKILEKMEGKVADLTKTVEDIRRIYTDLKPRFEAVEDDYKDRMSILRMGRQSSPSRNNQRSAVVHREGALSSVPDDR